MLGSKARRTARNIRPKDVSGGDALPLPDDVRARFARTDFILDMYESGVYDREEAGEKLFDHLFGKGRTVMDSED